MHSPTAATVHCMRPVHMLSLLPCHAPKHLNAGAQQKRKRRQMGRSDMRFAHFSMIVRARNKIPPLPDPDRIGPLSPRRLFHDWICCCCCGSTTRAHSLLLHKSPSRNEERIPFSRCPLTSPARKETLAAPRRPDALTGLYRSREDQTDPRDATASACLPPRLPAPHMHMLCASRLAIAGTSRRIPRPPAAQRGRGPSAGWRRHAGVKGGGAGWPTSRAGVGPGQTGHRHVSV